MEASTGGTGAWPMPVVNTDARKRDGLCAVGGGPSVLRTAGLSCRAEGTVSLQPLVRCFPRPFSVSQFARTQGLRIAQVGEGPQCIQE